MLNIFQAEYYQGGDMMNVEFYVEIRNGNQIVYQSHGRTHAFDDENNGIPDVIARFDLNNPFTHFRILFRAEDDADVYDNGRYQFSMPIGWQEHPNV